LHIADDKIIAVLDSDVTYGHIADIAEAPRGLIDRLRHYFLSYRQLPQPDAPRRVEIADVYDRAEADGLIRRERRRLPHALRRARNARRRIEASARRVSAAVLPGI
jgi:inorganic pyrophosphatase